MTYAAPSPRPPDTPGDAEIIDLFTPAPGAPPRVLIVEDHELLAQILVHALRGEGHTADLVGGPSAEAILAMAAQYRPEVVLLDVDLGHDVGTGVDLIGTLRDLGAVVVMLTGSTDRLTFAECLEAGAVGIVNKETSFEVLVEAVSRAAGGESLIPEHDRQDLLAELRAARSAETESRTLFERLTPRERQVLAALMEGRSATEIASTSFVSVTTVRSQIRSVLVKLGVTSQLAAVALAQREGWISLS